MCSFKPVVCAMALAAGAVIPSRSSSQQLASTDTPYAINHSHFDTTNYIHRGTDPRAFLAMLGTRVGHSALFGIPLQQQWSARVDGDRAPSYYLNTDAPLYYYSFTDAAIAMAYRAL